MVSFADARCRRRSVGFVEILLWMDSVDGVECVGAGCVCLRSGWKRSVGDRGAGEVKVPPPKVGGWYG